MEENNNLNNQPIAEEVNNNQNNQPETKEENKIKKLKIVAWWLKLGKWAKVGICAGTAAVLTTAITLPIVLTNKDNTFVGENIEFEYYQLGNYFQTKPIDMVKDKRYCFTLDMTKTTYVNKNVLFWFASSTIDNITNVAMKSDNTIFKNIGKNSDKDSIKQKEFAYYNPGGADPRYCAGKNSITTSEHNLTVAFTANVTFTATLNVQAG